METDTNTPAHPTPPSGPPDPRDNVIAQFAASLEQIRQEALQREAQHQAELHQLRQEMADTQAQQQAAQAADLQRRLDERDRAAQQAQYASEQEARQRHLDLLKQQQEAATANSNLSQRFSQMELRTEAQSREQARMAETSQGTQMILSDILRKLSELSTNRLEDRPPTNPAAQSHPHPAADALPDWDTPADLLPTHLRNAQIQYRERAIYDTVESPIPEDTRPTLIQNFLHDFRQTKHRDPQSSDFPHYRSTDLAPDPSRINYEMVYLPLLLQLTLRLAQLGAPPIPNDPLFHDTLEKQAAHQRNWALLRDRMSGTTLDPEEADFSTQFHTLANRFPTGTDIPTWSRIILTQHPPQGSLTNYYAYRRAAFQHVLDTHNAPSAHHTPTASGQPTPTPTGRNSPTILPTHTQPATQTTQLPATPTVPPLATEHNHPPIRGAPPPQLDSGDTSQPNRTAITTSPDLSLKRRARTTEDRNSTQASQKETQRQQRRTTRSTTLVDAAPTPPRRPCCNTRCAVTRTQLPEEFRCARTGNQMHYACSVSPSPNGDCLCHSCADPSPS